VLTNTARESIEANLKTSVEFDSIEVTIEAGEPILRFRKGGIEMFWLRPRKPLLPGETFTISGVSGSTGVTISDG
jgi:hypothetical protein